MKTNEYINYLSVLTPKQAALFLTGLDNITLFTDSPKIKQAYNVLSPDAQRAILSVLLEEINKPQRRYLYNEYNLPCGRFEANEHVLSRLLYYLPLNSKLKVNQELFNKYRRRYYSFWQQGFGYQTIFNKYETLFRENIYTDDPPWDEIVDEFITDVEHISQNSLMVYSRGLDAFSRFITLLGYAVNKDSVQVLNRYPAVADLIIKFGEPLFLYHYEQLHASQFIVDKITLQLQALADSEILPTQPTVEALHDYVVKTTTTRHKIYVATDNTTLSTEEAKLLSSIVTLLYSVTLHKNNAQIQTAIIRALHKGFARKFKRNPYKLIYDYPQTVIELIKKQIDLNKTAAMQSIPSLIRTMFKRVINQALTKNKVSAQTTTRLINDVDAEADILLAIRVYAAAASLAVYNERLTE